MESKKFFLRHWGKIYFALWSLGTIASLLYQQRLSGHFDIFVSAPRELWAGHSPYGIFYASGAWVYSPLAAVFYAPFAALPYFVGLGLLLIFSLGLFVAGLVALLRRLSLGPRSTEVLWALLSSETIGALMNTRLEMLIAGVLMGSLAWIIDDDGGRPVSTLKRWTPWILLALVANFKFQALAPVGLLLVYFVFCRGSWTPALRFALASGLCVLAPALAWGWRLNFLAHVDWIRNVNQALDISFYTFQHFYAFLRNTLGVEIPYRWTSVISLVIALLLAFWTVSLADFRRRVAASREDFLRAVALGCAFVCAFSPASQSAAFILYAPLLIFYFARQPARDSGTLWKLWLGGLLVGCFFISFAYSDLVGQAARDEFFRWAVKPVGVVLWLVLLGFFEMRKRKTVASSR